MGIIVCLFFLLLTIYLDINKKSTVVPIIIITVIGPIIKIGNLSIDSVYLYEIFLFCYILCVKGKIKIDTVNRYVKILLIILLIYTLSWLLFSRVNVSDLVLSCLGIIKTIVIIFECWTLNSKYKEKIEYDLFWAFFSILVINTLFLVFQSMFFEQSLMILKNIFLSENEYSFALAETYMGQYNRYGGLFKYPMHLGIFSVLTISFIIVFEAKGRYKWMKKITLLLAIYCGVMSSTKSFFIGLSVIYIAYVIRSIVIIRNKRQLMWCIVPMLVLILVIIFRNQLISGIQMVFGSYVSFYAEKIISFFDDFSSVFESRLGEDGAIRSLLDVVRHNFLFGVGPSSINGESVMDNAILVVLHNGGIIALVSVIYYYASTAILLLKHNKSVLIIIAIFACGMGFQIWVASYLTMWFCYYFDIKIRSKEIIVNLEGKSCDE